ncbi:MAG: methyltransferase domain-containing protein [Pseudonocardiaceae bacterium]
MSTPDPAQLAEELRGAGQPTEWLPAILAVPREVFIPDRVWVDEDGYQPVDRATDPQRWLRAVYSDVVVVTQFDDGSTAWPEVGRRPTCSASMPSAVIGMLTALDAQPGHRVLEIGTGTGYNAALLAHRLGARNVTTVEIDQDLLAQARRRLAAAGQLVAVIGGDGAAGYPPSAPYDRVLATATVRLGELPYRWVAQTRPGGRVVVPVRTEITSGPVFVFTVADDGRALGRPASLYVGFMELRGHRRPLGEFAGRTADDPQAEASVTELRPWTLFNHLDQKWALGVRLRGCRWRHRPPRDGRGHELWISDPVSGSWACAGYPSDGAGPYPVRQYGPRRLWDEAETAYHWWEHDLGRPPVEAWEILIGPGYQTHRLAGTPVSTPVEVEAV